MTLTAQQIEQEKKSQQERTMLLQRLTANKLVVNNKQAQEKLKNANITALRQFDAFLLQMQQMDQQQLDAAHEFLQKEEKLAALDEFKHKKHVRHEREKEDLQDEEEKEQPANVTPERLLKKFFDLFMRGAELSKERMQHALETGRMGLMEKNLLMMGSQFNALLKTQPNLPLLQRNMSQQLRPTPAGARRLEDESTKTTTRSPFDIPRPGQTPTNKPPGSK